MPAIKKFIGRANVKLERAKTAFMQQNQCVQAVLVCE
jgi:hypothetical protein